MRADRLLANASTADQPTGDRAQYICAEYYQQGLLNEAESRCQLAIEFAPTYAEPHNLLGLIAHARGQRPVAMEFFKKALSYKDDFAELHSNIGTILLEDGRIDEACDAFKEALGIDPGFVVARRNLDTVTFVKTMFPLLVPSF